MTSNTLTQLRNDLHTLKNPEKALILQRFFKTGKGQYGEGDVFLGITVPQSRKIAVTYKTLPLNDIKQLLISKIHEERLIGLLILVHNFETSPKKIYQFYLSLTKYINNWDLVDLSADKIVGAYLIDKKKDILYTCARSKNIWERRIAIVATYYFIKNNQFDDTLKIAEILLNDTHDLIQKAVGWMLREVGKRSVKTEEDFLQKHYENMPRTMLRYAIEKFPETKRKAYLRKKKLVTIFTKKINIPLKNCRF